MGARSVVLNNNNILIYIAPLCRATEALDDSQSGGSEQKCFQMFPKTESELQSD